jgi:hypothetical protein
MGWDVSIGASTAVQTTFAPIVVFDAASTGTDTVYATKTGLSIAGTTTTDLVTS